MIWAESIQWGEGYKSDHFQGMFQLELVYSFLTSTRQCNMIDLHAMKELTFYSNNAGSLIPF